MKGSYRVRISNSHLCYDFTIRRNITILKGNSASGKTTLVEMVSEYYEAGESSGIHVDSEVELRSVGGRDWKVLVSATSGSIIFIDEDNEFLTGNEFAEAIQNSDNYYVIVSREALFNLPYSVDEIYGIRENGKYAGFKKTYSEFYRIYSKKLPPADGRASKLIVEDSGSGADFFTYLSEDNERFQLISAQGKSNIHRILATDKEDGCILVIADGAAFGPEMDRLSKLLRYTENVFLYLPESFEWLILKSGLIDGKRIQEVLDRPEEYIDSKEYFSWERFFTRLLVQETEGTVQQYSKKSLNAYYTGAKVSAQIVTAMGPLGRMLGGEE